MRTQTGTPKVSVVKITFDIDVDPDGPSDAAFDIMADGFARNIVKHNVIHTPWRSFLSLFGLRLNPAEQRIAGCRD